jgi:hypothetical protein
MEKIPNSPITTKYNVTTQKKRGYHYKFPHTCINTCPDPHFMVCPHHECRLRTCGEKCVRFVCKTCCPDVPKTREVPRAECGAGQLILHAQLYEIGDKYDVTGLKELAREKFLRACTKYWNDDSLASAAHYAFSTTPEDDRGLREVVSNVISLHMELLNKPEIEALLHQFNGLAVGLLKARAKDLGWIRPA